MLREGRTFLFYAITNSYMDNSTQARMPTDLLVDTPEWLVTPVTSVTDITSIRPADFHKTVKEAMFANYAIIFERLLPELDNGRILSELLRETQEREPFLDISSFRRWVHSDPKRLERYYEAQRIGTECISDELLVIADACDSFEDIQRSKLKIDTRKWLLGVRNRQRFGEKVENIHQGGGAVNIFIEGVVSPYDKAAIAAVTIEHEPITPEDATDEK